MTGAFAIVPGRIQLRRVASDTSLRYYLFVPRRLDPQRRNVALVAVHGISRNARAHARALYETAEALGVVLIAPLFDGEAGEGYQRVWRRSVAMPADMMLDRMLADASVLVDARLNQLMLAGYSGGAQFAHRYALAHPGRILALALGAAGWYTMPDPSQPYPLGLNVDATAVPTPLRSSAWLRRPVLVYVGDRDLRRDHSLRADPRIDAQQGVNRLERAKRWVDALRCAAVSSGLPVQLTLRLLPGVGHDFDAAVTAGAVAEMERFFLKALLAQVREPQRQRTGRVVPLGVRAGRFAAIAASSLLAIPAMGAGSSAPATSPRNNGFDADPAAARGLRVSHDALTAEFGASLALDGAASAVDGAGQNTLLLRRARLSAAANLGSRWSLRVERDFSQVDPGWSNLWLQWRASERIAVRVGNQRAPFGLEDSTGFRSRSFTERSLANVFVPGTLVGVSMRAGGANSTLTAGVYRDSVDADDRRDLHGISAVLRSTRRVRFEHGTVLHAGASVEYRQGDRDASLRLRTRPETWLTNERLVNTRTVSNVSSMVNLGVDMAWQRGPVLLQGEWITSQVDRRNRDSLSFSGGYASAAWVVTGERRSYLGRAGSFDDIEPRRRIGALELAARFSVLDLDSGPIAGGKEKNFSVGLNWAVRHNVRVMLNWVHAEADYVGSPSVQRNYVGLRADAMF